MYRNFLFKNFSGFSSDEGKVITYVSTSSFMYVCMQNTKFIKEIGWNYAQGKVVIVP